MLSGSDDGLGGGLSCPEKDRCTNYSCAGGFLKRRSTIILHSSITQKTALNIKEEFVVGNVIHALGS
jgi:hypothetical protein